MFRVLYFSIKQGQYLYLQLNDIRFFIIIHAFLKYYYGCLLGVNVSTPGDESSVSSFK